MNSCLYECSVTHARLSPQTHRFTYRIFLFAIDLDELPRLPRALPLFSVGSPNLYSFRDRDYLPTDAPRHHPAGIGPGDRPPAAAGNLKQRVIDFLASRGVELPVGRILLVTLPRIAGYLFNPVSFYFCFDRDGAPVAALAEVTNTFREVKPYVLGPETLARDPSGDIGSGRTHFSLRVPKHFYVSPFSDVDVAFDFSLRVPGEKLRVQIDDYTGGERTLTSFVQGARRELTGARLAWFAVKYPLLSLQVISLIHWHALRLWWKRVPWFRKAARATDQRDLYRPHASLAAPAASPRVSPSLVSSTEP